VAAGDDAGRGVPGDRDPRRPPARGGRRDPL